MSVGECLHELAQHFRGAPVFSQARPLERLTQFPLNTDTEANVFARHTDQIIAWIHACVSKKCSA